MRARAVEPLEFRRVLDLFLMFNWSGIGWLVGVVIFGCLVATEYFVERAFADENYYQAHGWPKLAAFLAAAIIVLLMYATRKRRQSRILVDYQTGEEVVLDQGDSLFFVPLKYWPAICVVLGVVFFFVRD